jgi:hypothetical protein
MVSRLAASAFRDCKPDHTPRIANDVDGEVLFTLKAKNHDEIPHIEAKLASSIGITSYGIRVKIMNAINELSSDGECAV